MSKLTTIEGIGQATADRLKKAGVGSVESLLKSGASAAGRRNIADKAGVDSGRVLKYVNHADLMRIKGVGGEYAELLEAAGVDTVPELAQRSAENLTQKMSDVNANRKLVRVVPGTKKVTGWVQQAKRLNRVVGH